MAFVARACDQLSSHCEDRCSLYTLRHPSGTWQVGVLTISPSFRGHGPWPEVLKTRTANVVTDAYKYGSAHQAWSIKTSPEVKTSWRKSSQAGKVSSPSGVIVRERCSVTLAVSRVAGSRDLVFQLKNQ
jgi:hypothetical protein